MSAKDLASAVLLTIGVLIMLMCSIGVLLMRSPYARLHYVSPATSLGVIAIAAAVVVNDPLGQASAKAIIITILLVISSPIISHATARAAKTREENGLDEEGGGG